MKILYIATIGGFMPFFKSLIRELLDEGNIVDIACGSETHPIPDYYAEWGCKVYSVSCSRAPLDKGNLTAIREIREIVKHGKYDIVHCHTPVAGVCTRLACRKLRKSGLKVIYTAHGFHFYKGAPLKNWLIYYPIEKWLSRYTDVLITINKEDYSRAKKKFHAQKTEYVPGVGIDVEKFKNTAVDRNAKRKELGIPEDAFLMISVGELNKNKNHQVVIRALAQLNDSHIHYMIAGKGELLDYLTNLAKQLGVSDQVHFLGYRNDVAELYKISDVDVFPSIREGLGLAAIEGMAAGLPLICSDNRGTREYAVPNENACVCSTPMDYLIAIQKMYTSNVFADSLGKKGAIKADSFSVDSINRQMKRLYFDFK